MAAWLGRRRVGISAMNAYLEGYEAFRSGLVVNPWADGLWEHDKWKLGWDFAEQTATSHLEKLEMTKDIVRVHPSASNINEWTVWVGNLFATFWGREQAEAYASTIRQSIIDDRMKMWHEAYASMSAWEHTGRMNYWGTWLDKLKERTRNEPDD